MYDLINMMMKPLRESFGTRLSSLIGTIVPTPGSEVQAYSIGRRRRRLRIATYSPGMVGFGHIRRNASIALALRSSPLKPSIIMMAEAWQAGALPMPEGVDCITFPALKKDRHEGKRPRFLELTNTSVVALRSNVISAAVEMYDPDVLLGDHLPLGAAGELIATLKRLRTRSRTRCVLGMRDILQDSETVRRTWADDETMRAISLYYDAIWIYGDPVVHDPVTAYDLPYEVRSKARYLGYLDQRPRLPLSESQISAVLSALPKGRLMLCMVGGGQDGGALAEAFASAELPADAVGVVLQGPFMKPSLRRKLRSIADARRRMVVLDYVPDPIALVDRADRVVAMGGYNTMCEVLSFEKHALIVPRVKPKPEQLIRAERFRELGLVDVLHPSKLSAGAIGAWLSRDLGPAPRARSKVDLAGLDRLPKMLSELIQMQDKPSHKSVVGGTVG